MSARNLLQDLPADLPAELSEVFLTDGPLRLERIVSTGQSSPPGFWYDQDENEWVLLLAGAARLEREHGGGIETVELRPGDHCHLPPHCRHRVAWTPPGEPTVWLALWWPASA